MKLFSSRKRNSRVGRDTGIQISENLLRRNRLLMKQNLKVHYQKVDSGKENGKFPVV